MLLSTRTGPASSEIVEIHAELAEVAVRFAIPL